MVRFCGWNVRGLNWPNKQDDVKLFLHLNNIGQVRLLEAKITVQNEEKVANRLFQSWRWVHNFNQSSRGRIWIAWRPHLFTVQVISMTAQHIHCKICQLIDMQSFYITYIYGDDEEGQRQTL